MRERGRRPALPRLPGLVYSIEDAQDRLCWPVPSRENRKGMPNFKILVVDDDEAWREECVLLLESEGFVVETCGSYETARAIFRSRASEIDLAIIDLRLGSYSGREL